jgi:hypothetical protein
VALKGALQGDWSGILAQVVEEEMKQISQKKEKKHLRPCKGRKTTEDERVSGYCVPKLAALIKELLGPA